MSIDVSCGFVKILDVAIWRINFLTNPLIFNGPFYNSTTIVLINCLKYELEELELMIDVSIEELVADCFICFINRFNTLLTCCNLTICSFSNNQNQIRIVRRQWNRLTLQKKIIKNPNSKILITISKTINDWFLNYVHYY